MVALGVLRLRAGRAVVVMRRVLRARGLELLAAGRPRGAGRVVRRAVGPGALALRARTFEVRAGGFEVGSGAVGAGWARPIGALGVVPARGLVAAGTAPGASLRAARTGRAAGTAIRAPVGGWAAGSAGSVAMRGCHFKPV